MPTDLRHTNATLAPDPHDDALHVGPSWSDALHAAVSAPERRAALSATGMLDSAPERAYDRLTRIATTVLRVPIALVTLVDSDRTYFKSCVGLPDAVAEAREVPFSHSLCQHVVGRAAPLVIENARVDSRFASNLAVRELGLVAYAGMPLTTPDGHVLGSFCAIDLMPRAWSAHDLAVLEELAASAMTEITLRHAVHERSRAEQALRASEERLALALAATRDGLWDWHVTSGDVHFGTRWGEMLGYAVGELPDRIETFQNLLHPDDAPRVEQALAAHLSGREPEFGTELRLRTRAGGWHWVLSRGNVVERDTAGAPVRMVGTHVDIEDRKALESELVRHARHDALTGLANRTLFHERLSRALHREENADLPVSVLFMDLDDFKAVNDSRGHAVGDRLLVAVAERLLSATRGSDTVARLGGDEFAVLLEGLRDGEDVSVVVPRILQAFQRPVLVGTQPIRVSTSVGVARAERGATLDDLLRHADVAMYRAKRAGKNRYATFSLQHDGDVLSRSELQTDLIGSLDRGEIRLMYQPIVDLQSGWAVGAEALVRWQHPVRGLVSPDAFIPLAESTGFMPALGRWILRDACTAAAAWPLGRSGAACSLSVNVSGRQLEDARFLEDVTDALHSSGLAPERLVLEVTESLLLADPAATRARLEAVRALGVRVAVDDFGTGYSSLTSVRQLPLDTLKIDKAFTQGISHDHTQRALTDTVIRLAAALRLQTVAEGIETAADRDVLLALGCGLGQGYLYARPLTPAAFGAFLSTPAGEAGTPVPEPPARPHMAVAPRPDTPATPTDVPGSTAPTVLVVDDDPGVRATVTRALTGAGFGVIGAGDGAAALRELASRRGTIALVLADVIMPELGGWALADVLRHSHPELPVVLMSGYEEADWCDMVGASPALRARHGHDILHKPLTRRSLLDAVHAALPERRRGRRAHQVM